MPKTKTSAKQPDKKTSLHKKTSLFDPKYLLALIAFVGIGGYVIWRIVAAPNPPTIYLTPSSQTMPANTSFSIQVRENSATTGVNAVQANFSYDATLVDFVSIDPAPQGCGGFAVAAQSTGGTGSVQIARGVQGGCPALTGDQLVATVNFKSKTTTGTTNMAFISGTALVSATTNQDILPNLAATGGGSYLVDTTSPSVNVSFPTNGSNVSSLGNTTISMTASDNNSVSSVDVYIDGVKKATLTSSPYTYTWNITGTSLGSHTIQVKATDPSGNVGSSAVSTVNVTDQTAPTVSITAPTSSSLLRGTVAINATAADTGGTSVTKVEFYVDGVLKGTSATAPYTNNWDTTTSTNATHSLSAKAYDGATPANVTTSTTVSVTVDNSAPSTPTNFTSTGNSQTTISLSWSASTDNVAVTGYRITRNGSTIATTAGTTLSYTDSNLSSNTSYTYTIVALDSAGNASAAASLTTRTATPVAGDCNGDNHVDVSDLSVLLTKFNTNYASCDFNNDSIVNIFDLSILLTNFGT